MPNRAIFSSQSCSDMATVLVCTKLFALEKDESTGTQIRI